MPAIWQGGSFIIEEGGCVMEFIFIAGCECCFTGHVCSPPTSDACSTS